MQSNGERPAVDAAAMLRADLQADLVSTMKSRESETVALLRTVIAAIDNAQAVATADVPAGSGAHIAGAQAGVGSTEVARRALSVCDVRALLQGQIEERERAAAEYEGYDQHEIAERLRGEATRLQAYVDAWVARYVDGLRAGDA